MSTRLLAGIAVAGQVAFIASWAAGGVAEPGYSTAEQTVSELFSGAAEQPWVVQAGLVALMPSYLASALLARRLLAPRGIATVALLALAALLVLAVLLNPLDCMVNGNDACEQRVGDRMVSDAHRRHYLAAVLLQLTLVATPFTAAWALRGRRGAMPALALGVLAIAAVAGFMVAPDAVYGIAQRVMFGAVTVCITALAAVAVARDKVAS